MKRLGMLCGGGIGLVACIVGYVIAGVPGEIVGIFCALPFSALLGWYLGGRNA